MPRAQRLVVGYFRLLLRIFFRRIEVVGLENVPEDRGGLLVAWHPNGAVDGAVLMSTFPRRIVFGARHGLLELPVLGWMMRQCGCVPIYRSQDMREGEDDAARQVRNRQSIDALAQSVADGDFAALFPEGRSHDEPFVHQLKTGAAHLYYRACDLTAEGAARPVIVPVALHYSKKRLWGSQILVTYHPPLELPEEIASPTGEETERRLRARKLTAELDRTLREAILSTESWELHHLFHRARKLIRAEGFARAGQKSAAPDIRERIQQFGSIWKRYQEALARQPEDTHRLLDGVTFYDRCLRALRVEDHELDGATWKLSGRRTLLLLLELLVVYLVLPFFLLIGVLVNLPTMLLMQGLTKLTARKHKDEASIKVLVGAIAFPFTWTLAASLVTWGSGILAAGYPELPYSAPLTWILAFLLSAFGGLLAIHFRQLATETLRTLRVRLTLTRRKHAVEWLLEERGRLFDRFMALDRELGPSSPR